MISNDSMTRHVFICGSALRGQPDHQGMADSRFIRAAKTRATYRLHAVADGWHPGIYEVAAGGISIPGEVYEMTQEQFEKLCAVEPPNLYPADVVLENEEVLTAFFYPQELIEQYNWPDISHLGSWTVYKANSLT